MKEPRGYGYAYEKLHEARRALMAPHGSKGEDGAFIVAFGIIGRMTPDNVADLPEPAAEYCREISRLRETTGLQPAGIHGLVGARVALMTHEERADFSRNVDELANWLSRSEHARGM